MPIFRYTFKKILMSPSTWVIFVLTLIILGLTWGILAATLLPISFVSGEAIKLEWTKELVLSLFLPIWKLLVFTGFIALMVLIFVGVKSTQIFRDEIDDGTLLILVSKPISRSRIWTEKWLSLQVTVVLFIFFSIFLTSCLLIIPRIGSSVLYLTLLPYMAILFGISLLFEVIFTSIVLLLSLVLNSKATIALTIGFAALINIFSQGIEALVTVPSDYFNLSQAIAVYHDVEKKISGDDFNWFKEQFNNVNYQADITNIMKKVYENEITSVNYPDEYDPIKEQEAVTLIISGASTKGTYSSEDITLLGYIYDIANVFRQWKEQSYEELMTAEHVGGWVESRNHVDYSAFNVVSRLNKTFDQATVSNYNSKITKKKIMRYFNIFYQLYYLWDGAWGEKNSLYVNEGQYESYSDPYLISFDENKNDNSYQVDFNSGKSKIINFPALVSIYVLLALVLLATSWYVFNRRDFA